MICNLAVHSQYTYSINYNTESRYSLSLGSLERTLWVWLPSFTLAFPLEKQTSFQTPITRGDVPITFLSPPTPCSIRSTSPPTWKKSVIKPSHFVSFPDSTPYETVINRLETIQLLGVNVIELHALEQSSCDAEYDICWMEPSYSPGLLRPTIGTPNQLKEMIDYIHMLNMSVVLDLNWEFFNINSPIYHYHQFYTLCKCSTTENEE